MGILTPIIGRAADAIMTRSPAYREATTKLKEATELVSIYSILDPQYWYHAGTTTRDMSSDVRDTISRQAWTFYQTNPHAAGYVNNVAAFAIGPGFEIHHPDEAADLFIQDYMADDDFMTLAAEAMNQYLIAAENPTLIFLNLLTGSAKVRVFDPLELYDVAFDAEDNRKVVALWRRYTKREAVLATSSWTWVTSSVEDIIQHDERRMEEWGAYTVRDFVFHKRPTLPSATRGVSFLTPSLRWFKEYEKLLEARLYLNRARATYARDLELGDINGRPATQKECDDIQTALNQKGEPRPGAYFVHNSATKQTFPMPNVGAGDAKDDMRAFTLMFVAGLCTPEYLITGDASNANFASTTNLAQAFIKNIQKLESDFHNGWIKPVFARILRTAADARVISAEAAALPVETTYPQIMTEALDQLVAMITAGVAQGWLDEETAVALLPFKLNYATIKERRDAARDEKIKHAGGFPAEHPPEQPAPAEEETP